MKAIRTRYSGPTNTRGSRIHATDADGHRISVSYNHAIGDPHEFAAYTLMRRMQWSNELVGGGFGHDQYWVMLPRESHVPPFYEVYFKEVDRYLSGVGTTRFDVEAAK